LSTSAHPRKRIQLAFDDIYYIEPSFECRFDHIEIRDGPFGFSPIIDRFCGPKSPGVVTSTGRFMWIKFISDEELEGLGFRVKYTFIAGNPDPAVISPSKACSWNNIPINPKPTHNLSLKTKGNYR